MRLLLLNTKIDAYLLFMSMFLTVLIGCSNEVNYTPPEGSVEIAITHYSFGKIIVNGKAFENDIAIYPDRKVQNWQAQINHSIQLTDIKNLITESTETLIIGIGAIKGCSVSDEIIHFTGANQITLHILNTYEAVKLFNASSKDGLAACFHVNC